MSETFDPYRKWLGIPLAEQPPHHYRLLGIGLFENDPDVIESAADQRMSHLRSVQLGARSEMSQRLLNEVAAAKVCLLSPDRKAAYDAELHNSLYALSHSAYSSLPTAAPIAAANYDRVGIGIPAQFPATVHNGEEPPAGSNSDGPTHRPMALWSAAGLGTAMLMVATGFTVLGGRVGRGPMARAAIRFPMHERSPPSNALQRAR